jgi:hypothetical protein
VAALAQVAAAVTANREIPAALGRYEDLRLSAAARHVAASERATAAYLAHAAPEPHTGSEGRRPARCRRSR